MSLTLSVSQLVNDLSVSVQMSGVAVAINPKVGVYEPSSVTEQFMLQAEAAAAVAEEQADLAIEARNEAQEVLTQISKVKLADFVTNTSYIGTAPDGTLENQPLWTVSKIVVDVDGTTVKTVATDVAWTDRLTETYT